jgi:hypothetical protein
VPYTCQRFAKIAALAFLALLGISNLLVFTGLFSFMSNLLAIRTREAKNSDVRTEVIGTLVDSRTRFSAIELYVSADSEDRDLIERLVEIADRGCIMMNTLRGKLYRCASLIQMRPRAFLRRLRHTVRCSLCRCARWQRHPRRFECTFNSVETEAARIYLVAILNRTLRRFLGRHRGRAAFGCHGTQDSSQRCAT